MTAEISVMNKAAVAMAADSAVTAVGKKVYNTGSKLFPVTHKMPIGIMFYGNAHLLGMPWDTVVASFRKHVEDKEFETVRQCGEAFVEFLNTNEELFPIETQKKYYLDFLGGMLNMHLNTVNQKIQQVIKENGEIKEEKIKEELTAVFDPEFLKWNEAPFVPGIKEAERSALLESYDSDFNQVIDKVFQNLPFSQDFRSNLKQLCANYAYRALVFNAHKSGVVFSGFGEKENYPSLFAAELELIVEKKLKYIIKENFEITDSQPASIHPFAQQDVVYSFLKGIDPSFLKLIEGYLGNFFEGIGNSVNEKIPDTVAKKQEIVGFIDDLKKQSGPAIMGKLEEVSQGNFVNPVVMAAQILSKDDLAHMAETLVSMTSFRRKISLDLETVGGPVDVAVISKKDGFIWIKRKHYFKPEMNPHYFRSDK